MKTYILKVTAGEVGLGRFVDALLAAGAVDVSVLQSSAATMGVRTTVPALAQSKSASASAPATMVDVLEQYFAKRGKGVAVHAKDESLAAALKEAGYKTRPDTALHNAVTNYHVKIKKVAPATYAYTG